MMKKFLNISLVVLILALVGFFAHNAMAQIAPPEKTKIQTMADAWITGDVLKKCPNIPIFVYNWSSSSERERFSESSAFPPTQFTQTSLSHSLVFCADLYIRMVSIPFIFKYTVLMSQVVSAALVLAIMVFSFKVFMGQANIKSLTFAFFFKIVIVLTVIGSNPFNAISGATRLMSIKETLVQAPREFGGKIVEALYSNSPTGSSVGFAKGGYNTIKTAIEAIPVLSGLLGVQTINVPNIPMPPPLPNVTMGSLTIDLSIPSFYESGLMFQLFDKHISVVLDLKDIKTLFDSNNEKTTKVGIAAIIGGLLLASDITAMVSIVILIYIMVLVVALAQAVLLFITAHLILTILIAMAPIVMPCLLFAKTEHITKKWFMAIISYSLQPLIFVAFFAFTVLLLDKFSSPISNAVNGNIFAKIYQNSWSKMLNECNAPDPADCDKPENRTFVNMEMDNVLNFFMNKEELDKLKSGAITAQKARDKEQNDKKIAQAIGLNYITSSQEQEESQRLLLNAIINMDDHLTPEQIQKKIDSGQGVLTSQDFRVYTAALMALTLLLVILVSFLKIVPDIVEGLIGREAPGAMGIAAGVTQPIEQLTNMVDKQSSNIRSKSKQATLQEIEQEKRRTN